MSILNAWIERERAWVSVDGFAFTKDGEPIGAVAKMIVLPHLNAIVGFRGTYAIFAVLSAHVMLHSHLPIERLQLELPRILSESVEQVHAGFASATPEQRLQLPPLELLQALDCVLVGYSPAQRQMVGTSYRQSARGGVYTGEQIQSGAGSFAPADQAFMERVRVTGSIEYKLVALAKMQMQFARERNPVPATGGRLLIATIDPKGMGILPVAELS